MAYWEGYNDSEVKNGETQTYPTTHCSQLQLTLI